jgi:hypothetical protein
MGKWGQSPTYTVSHDRKRSREVHFRCQRSRSQNRSPCKKVFWVLGGGKVARNQPALGGPKNRPSLAQEAKTSLKRRGSRVWGAVERRELTREHPLGNTPQVQHPLGTIPRGGLAVVARAHKCSRSNELSCYNSTNFTPTTPKFFLL